MSGKFPVDAGKDSCGGADSCVPGRLCQSLPALISAQGWFYHGGFTRIFSIQELLSWRPWFPVCLTCRENKAGISLDGWVSPGPFLGQGLCW